MDEKEAVKNIRWELSKGKSRAEITRNLQGRGLKLEFIDSLISRAKRPRRILKGVFFSVIVIVLVWMSTYAMFFYHDAEKVDYSPSWINKSLNSEGLSLEITPELVSLVASEIGATKLRRNPVNLKKPIMNFQISEQSFYSVVDKKIETFEGTSDEADLSFYTESGVVEKAFGSADFKEELKKAIADGKITVEKLAPDQDLFLKGYLNLYNELGGL